jgi:large subunit ribosomal protein L25
MSQQIEITAELRQDVGKGASRRLRRTSEKVPGIIYGAGQDPQSLTLNGFQLSKAMQQESFFSQILNVSVEGDSQQAIVRDLQRHPANEKVLHIDFLRVRADQPIDVNVPIHFINEEQCKGVRLEGGVVSHNLTDIEISCLPADLPEFIEVDIAELGVGEAIHQSDLVVPSGVTIVQLALGEDHDISVVTVNEPRVSAADEPAEGEEQAPEQPEADQEEPGED